MKKAMTILLTFIMVLQLIPIPAFASQEHECPGKSAIRHQHGADPLQDHGGPADPAAEGRVSLCHAFWV